MPSGTISDTAATITLQAALPENYTGGVWGYMAANQIKASIAAAWHWAVATSTTVLQICQETYNPATQTPYVPASCTAFTDAVPGGTTGYTADKVLFAKISKPANALGVNGWFTMDAFIRASNGGGTYRLNYGSTQVASHATSSGQWFKAKTQNRGVINSQSTFFTTGSTMDSVTAVTDANAYDIGAYVQINSASAVAGYQTLELTYSKAPL
jgi:hypothetical protein